MATSRCHLFALFSHQNLPDSSCLRRAGAGGCPVSFRWCSLRDCSQEKEKKNVLTRRTETKMSEAPGKSCIFPCRFGVTGHGDLLSLLPEVWFAEGQLCASGRATTGGDRTTGTLGRHVPPSLLEMRWGSPVRSSPPGRRGKLGGGGHSFILGSGAPASAEDRVKLPVRPLQPPHAVRGRPRSPGRAAGPGRRRSGGGGAGAGGGGGGERGGAAAGRARQPAASRHGGGCRRSAGRGQRPAGSGTSGAG